MLNGTTENLHKYIKLKTNELVNSHYTFKSLFEIIHHQDDDKIFSECLVDYKIYKVTYQTFKAYCFKMATYLNQIRDDKHSYVGLYMENSLNWIACFWAILILGYKPVLLNCKLPLEVNQNIVNNLSIKTIITNNSIKISNHEIIIDNSKTLRDDVLLLDEYNNDTWEDELALSTTATSLNYKVCCYKGSDLTYQVLNVKGILAKNKMVKQHYDCSLKLLTFLPFYHIFGLVATYFWFSLYGRTFVFLNDYSGDTILKTVRRHNVTHLFAVPLLWNTIAKEVKKKVALLDQKEQTKYQKGLKLCLTIQNIFPKWGMNLARKLFKDITSQTLGDSIKFLISGGGYISDETLRMINGIGYPLFNGYGSTEIGITSVELRSRPKYRILGTIGKPFDSVKYQIKDDILYVKGMSMCSKIIYKDGTSILFNKDEWYNTKDLVRQDKKGYYYINGRNDDVIIGNNGEKYSPDLIEQQILLSCVNNYCLFGYHNELCFIVEIDQNINIIKKQTIYQEVNNLIKNLRDKNYPINKVYYTNNNICNKNAIKVSRSYLLNKINNGEVKLNDFELLLTNNTQDNNQTIENEIEKNVQKIFAEVLNKDTSEIGLNQHFMFDLGGTSLEYCTLLIKLQNEFEMDFKLDNQTLTSVNDFASYIMRGK